MWNFSDIEVDLTHNDNTDEVNLVINFGVDRVITLKHDCYCHDQVSNDAQNES